MELLVIVQDCVAQVLDDVTLENLDVLDHEGKRPGTLLERVDHTSTPFGKQKSCYITQTSLLCLGKRLLKQWVCSPSCDPTLIAARLDAIDDFLQETAILVEVKVRLKKLPDLERLLRKSVQMLCECFSDECTNDVV